VSTRRLLGRAQVSFWAAPSGGLHIRARFAGDDRDVTADTGPVTGQFSAARAAAALITSELAQRIRAMIQGDRGGVE
jgi:hypothetical protein